jgi:hypothetical protein
MTKPLIINRETGISLGILVSIVSGIIWLSTVNADVKEHSTQIKELKEENSLIKKDITEILLNTRELKVRLELKNKDGK